MDDTRIIEAMALAICNSIRADNALAPLKHMGGVDRADCYRRQAEKALAAYRRHALGR